MLAGAYPSRRVRRAEAADHLGPRHRRHRGPPRRPGRRGHERRHDPGPRAVRRVHGRRGGDARPAGRRARRGDGLREPGRRGHHARGEQLADRGDRPRPGDRVAGAGRARQAAVLARRRGRPADRARAGRSARSSARSRTTSAAAPRGRKAATDRLRADHDLDELAAENLLAYLEDEREVVGALPTDRRIVVERFRDELGDWRLVLLTPFGGRVHAPWSLALEARIGERLGARGPDDLVRRRDRDPPARRGGRARRRDRAAVPGSRRGRGPGRRPGRVVRAVRLAVPGERDAGAAPAAPPARDADAALAAAPAGRRPARRRLALRQLPDPRRDVPRGPLGRLRPAGPARGPRRHPAPRDRGPRRRDRPRRARSRARSCSTTSPPTCTTATRRWPSGGPAR